MVNYCIVSGCGRNSKNSKHLYFYGVPKETDRQKEWLAAANRKDLLKKTPDRRVTFRICSRHFSREHVKNKHLCADAVPTLNLPGSKIEDDLSLDNIEHEDILCNNCKSTITGFRYKCATCLDYDLCANCEMLETHSEHFVIRIATPLKFKALEEVLHKLRNVFKEVNYVTCDGNTSENDSSDDEPITKYARNKESKNYDSGIDLSENIKSLISQEVDRVLKIRVTDDNNKYRKKLKTKTEASKSRKRAGNKLEASNKKQKLDDVKNENELHSTDKNIPEVAFADMNEIVNDQIVCAKTDGMNASAKNKDSPAQPMLHMKLSDDFSEFILLHTT